MQSLFPFKFLKKPKLSIKIIYYQVTREDTREFIECLYEQIGLDNVKETGSIHFKENYKRDLSASQQGPSYACLDQTEPT